MRRTQEDFISEATELWEGRWDYSAVEFKTTKSAVTIGCRLHGYFKQRPQEHLRHKVGCGLCSGSFMDTELFKDRAYRVWGDRWDYSAVEYENSSKTLRIKCPQHNKTFYQTASNHLSGKVGCNACSGRNLTTSEFVDKLKEVWGDRWDYSKTEFKTTDDKVIVTCPKHGDFYQRAMSLLKGMVGCTECSGIRLNPNSFMSRVQQTWGGRWDYEDTKFEGVTNRLSVRCRDHGVFEQRAETHLLGRVGCRSCQSPSLGEVALSEFVTGLGFEVDRNRRDLLDGGLELDIYVPSKKVALEFNGVYYHSSKFKDKSYHAVKLKECQRAGIRLLQVWEDDWTHKGPIIREHIAQVLGVSTAPKISARDTQVRLVPRTQAFEFMNSFHIQGAVNCSVYLGLYLRDALVALAGFKKNGSNYTLSRYATSGNVRGGHSKIVKNFENSYHYNKLVTFADLAFSDGGLYQATGWSKDKEIPPDYTYLQREVRVHKSNFRVASFRSRPDLLFEEGLSERELADLNNLLRVYDSGKVRFVKQHP